MDRTYYCIALWAETWQFPYLLIWGQYTGPLALKINKYRVQIRKNIRNGKTTFVYVYFTILGIFITSKSNKSPVFWFFVLYHCKIKSLPMSSSSCQLSSSLFWDVRRSWLIDGRIIPLAFGSILSYSPTMYSFDDVLNFIVAPCAALSVYRHCSRISLEPSDGFSSTLGWKL
jgi:hypothetical protein